MACEAVGVILAQFRTGFPRWEDQYLAPIGGLPVTHRLRRALTAGGVEQTLLLTDLPRNDAAFEGDEWLFCDPQSVESLAQAARRIFELARGRVVLLVRGDRPLLSERTVAEILSRCPDVSVDGVYEESGAICAIRNPDAILDLLTVLLRSSETTPADRVTVEADDAGRRIDVFPAVHVHDALRLSTPEDLVPIDRTARRTKAQQLVRDGVRILDPERTVIDDDVRVGSGTTVYPGSYLRGTTEIGRDCQLGPDAWIENAVVGDGCTVRYSVVESARVRAASSVGPYAHLRAGADVGPEVRIGNFVEVKAARLEKGVKAGHLSYLGDTQVGERTNIGAGTITCNYDGKSKHRTVIGKDAFVGSHASLVAPVTIGEGALIAAGSTITEDVPDGATAFGRARQVVKRPADESEGDER